MPHTTFNNIHVVRDQPLDLETLKNTMNELRIKRFDKEKRNKRSWFVQLMNHFGWYRGAELVVIDTNQFNDLSNSYGAKRWLP